MIAVFLICFLLAVKVRKKSGQSKKEIDEEI
jgi:hypothetical protein